MAQIPLGLTLYGSPLVLFILYAVYMFLLIVSYFILEFHRGRHQSSATVTTDTGYDYHTQSSEKTDKKGGLFGKAAKVGLGIFAAKKAKNAYDRHENRDVNEINTHRNEYRGTGRYERGYNEEEDEESYVVDNRRNVERQRSPTRQSPSAKTGLLAGLLASGGKKKNKTAVNRPSSPTSKKPGLFGGLLGRRKRNVDLSMGASPKKVRRQSGTSEGWFNRRRSDRQNRRSVTDLSTGYDSDYESTNVTRNDRNGRYHHHRHSQGHSGAAAAAAGAAAAGGLAAAHHHRRRDVSPSEDSYLYSEVDRSNIGGHGNLQPPPAAQNVGRLNNNSRLPPSTLATSMTRTTDDDQSRFTASGYTNTVSGVRTDLPNPNTKPQTVRQVNPSPNIPVTNPNFYQMPEPSRLVDSAAQVSTANLPPPPGGPPLVPIPAPPVQYDANRPSSYRLQRSGSSSGRPSFNNINTSNNNASAYASTAAGLGVNTRNQNDNLSESDLSFNEPRRHGGMVSAATAAALLKNSHVENRALNTQNNSNNIPLHQPVVATVTNTTLQDPALLSPVQASTSRSYRIPQTVTSSDETNTYNNTAGPSSHLSSAGDSTSGYLPQASLQVRIKKEEGGRTVTTIKRMPGREERTSVDGSTPTSPNITVIPGGRTSTNLNNVNTSSRNRSNSRHHHNRGASRDSDVVHVREEKRRSESSGGGGRRGTGASGSVGVMSGDDVAVGNERWKRNERREEQEEDEMRREREERRDRRQRRRESAGYEPDQQPQFT